MVVVVVSAVFRIDVYSMTAAFAPFGAIARWLLGRLLNKRVPNFPIGTFVANIIGSGLLGMAYVLSLSEDVMAGSESCKILQGFALGFTGE